MRAAFPQELTFGTIQIGALRLSREKALPRIALMGIVALAAALRFDNLAALGYVNHYYTAAVASMLQSWHNFFYAAAEPGGAVSVDKPPVGLWLQTISAYFLGLNGFAVLLPQIVAGILSVIVIYHLVHRWFGTAAGLLAALALAITPVVVAVDRNNTMDSTLILTLLLAAWAFIKATETGKLRYLVSGAALVGIGFNVKMLEAYLPLPAFYALYLLGSRERLTHKLPKLALATVLLLVVSLSWAVAVDLTPAEERPYVGSSGDNSALSLAIGYNGLQRLVGPGPARRGLLSGLLGGGSQGPGPGDWAPSRQPVPGGARRPPGPGANGVFMPPGPGAGGLPPPFARGVPGGLDGIGQPGALRMFSAPLSKEVGWLLPIGIFGAVLLVLQARPRWPIARPHQAMVLWGSWLLTGAVFFSVAGFFHEYYLAMLAAPLAALVGIGVMALWRVREQRQWLATVLLLIVAGGTLGLQFTIATAFVNSIWWLPVVVGLFVAGAIVSVIASLRPRRRWAVAGYACVVASTLLTPAIWSGMTTLNASENLSLPSAYSGRTPGPVNRGGLRVKQGLLDYLQPRTQSISYLMAVPSSMQGADYVIATGRPVLYLGGFNGSDRVVDGDDLARLMANGKLRYVYWNADLRGGPAGGQSEVSAWVSANCAVVEGFDTVTRNMGPPDGAGTGPPGAPPPGPGIMRVRLYDCGGGPS